MEIGYWLENALEGLTEEEREKVKTLVREGRIELCPLYVSHTSDFNDEETLIRSLYFTFQFAEECGAEVKCAMASDSPRRPFSALTSGCRSQEGCFSASLAILAMVRTAPTG